MTKGHEGEVIECSREKKIVLKSAPDARSMSCHECVFSAIDCSLVPRIEAKCCDIYRGCWQEWKADAP